MTEKLKVDDLAQYDSESLRLQAAYEAFAHFYTSMNPPPMNHIVEEAKVTIKTLAMILGLIGSVIVSASHTVPVLVGVDSLSEIGFGYEFLLATASFVMVELMAITFAYQSTEAEVAKGSPDKVNQRVSVGKWFVVVIMVLFNLYYILNTNNVPLPDFMRIGIFVFIGTSAPVIAFLCGDIWAVDSLKRRSRKNRDTKAYDEAMNDWRDKMNKQWGRVKGQWNGEVTVRAPDRQTDRQLPVSAMSTDNRQTTDSIQLVLSHLADNPEDYTLTLRRLGEIVGVKKDSVAKAKKLYQSNGA